MAVDEHDDISLYSLSFSNILQEESLYAKNIFVVDKLVVNGEQNKKSVKKRVRKKKDMKVMGSSPERSTSIGKSHKEKYKETELKRTERLDIVINPMFKFIKDN